MNRRTILGCLIASLAGCRSFRDESASDETLVAERRATLPELSVADLDPEPTVSDCAGTPAIAATPRPPPFYPAQPQHAEHHEQPRDLRFEI